LFAIVFVAGIIRARFAFSFSNVSE